MPILDPVLGGKIRAIFRATLYAIPLIAGAAGWANRPIVATILGLVMAADAIVSTLVHGTTIGNVPADPGPVVPAHLDLKPTAPPWSTD